MKIKFTLQRPAGPVDLAATVDSAATVGDLAAHLLAADPARRPGPPSTATPTLTLAGGPTLDPRQPLGESPLRSGAEVSVSAAGGSYVDAHSETAAVVRVVDGPDAGKEFPLARGSSIVGRERGVEVRLSDPMVSRRHARINVTDVVEIIDLGSANGVQLDELAVPRAILRPADVAQVGDTRLSVRRLPAAGSGAAAPSAAVEFVRPPRLDPVYEGRTFEAPELPERERTQRFPIVPLLAPIAMGAAIYLITKSLASLVFIGLSPLMLVGNAIESRFAGRAAFARALEDFRSDVAVLVEDATAAADAERAARGAEHPSLAECIDAAAAATPLLWTRRPGERAFGDVRLGLGRLASRSVVELPSAKRGPRAVYRELLTAVSPFTHVDDVPVVASLSASPLGIGGPRPASVAVTRSVLAQLAALHSPAELVFAAVTSSQSAEDWDWLKWLPHTSSPHSPLTGRHLASGAATATTLLSELDELVAARAQAGATCVPAVVLLVENDAPVVRSRLVALTESGAAHGVFVVWRSDELTDIPAACKEYLDLTSDGRTGQAGYLRSATSVLPVAVDALDAAGALALAKRLAPVVDVSAGVSDASDLPRAVSLLSLTGPELAASPEAVIERWTESRSIVTGPFAPAVPSRNAGTLRAVLGQSASQVHALDLRADGPHALVGGTTGAGKSELLQSWILAMAAAHSPQRLTFLLVDYKGGSAFRDCVDLPHTVGLVTDLSPHLVRRALTSLSAELRYREHILAAHAAKDLVTMEKQGVADTPPSLVIVVDEFAALVNEVPEFVDGVVNVAQRGRSLGLHLILATQRPAGVIKDNLRANTNLRLALRMADETDSTDVLGSTDAAFFDPALPGRAVSKTGPGRLVPFQTGYAGGWTSDDPPAPDILVEELTAGVAPVWALPETPDATPTDPGPTDIRRLVDSIQQANALARIEEPRRPWLPELRSVYDLSDQGTVPSRRTDRELVFGVRDDPDSQSQPTVAFFPDRDGNLAVYGTGGSGKTTLLRTLAIAAGFTVRGGPCHVYGIDFGARGLSMLDDLPHVGSIVAGADHERVTRLLGWLRALIDERAVRYSQANAGTITDYRAAAGAADEPRILLLVDGVAAFRQAYETSDRQRWFDMFVSLATDGRPVGVHVIVSSDQRSGLTTSLASAVQRRIVLRLATAEEYSLLGAAPDVITPASPAGRGVLDDHEVQIALLGADVEVGAQARAVRQFAEAMRRSGARQAPPIRRLPEHVAFDSLPPAIDGAPVLGLAGETLEPMPFDPRGGFVISGPPGSGRTATLLAVAHAISRARPSTRFVLFSPRATELSRHRIWNATATGAQEVAAAAASLTAELPSRLATDGDGLAVFVEALPELNGGAADMALAELLRTCTSEGLPFVVEGETAGLTGNLGVLGQIKASRAGIALAPESSDGPSVYRTNFPPRLNRAEFPPGRGLLVRLGKAFVVQVAAPDGG